MYVYVYTRMKSSYFAGCAGPATKMASNVLSATKVISNMLSPGKTPHYHYIYKMGFNSISRTATLIECNISEQKELMKEQAQSSYAWANGSKYLAYAKIDHCSLIETITEVKQASKASATRDFPVVYLSSLTDIGLGEEATNILTEEVNHLSPACGKVINCY